MIRRSIFSARHSLGARMRPDNPDQRLTTPPHIPTVRTRHMQAANANSISRRTAAAAVFKGEPRHKIVIGRLMRWSTRKTSDTVDRAKIRRPCGGNVPINEQLRISLQFLNSFDRWLHSVMHRAQASAL